MVHRNVRRALHLLLLLVFASVPLVSSALAQPPSKQAGGAVANAPAHVHASNQGSGSAAADTSARSSQTSHRLIVELKSPPLAVWAAQKSAALKANGRLNLQSAAAQTYLAQLRSDQAAFAQALSSALPGAAVSTYLNETGASKAASYQIAFNGMSVDPGSTNRDVARKALLKLPNVKNVYLDFAHSTNLYTSTMLINAPAIWDSAAVGGRTNAGMGVKVASMDGGLHKDAPMFSGAGFSYPPDFPTGGLGLQSNNNGKIIASRAYFRSWDPPAPGDENPWPGENGTPHGNHTGGIAAGNIVTATYLGLTFPNMSGVAPKAWLMSYRVFYASVNGNQSFFDTEGLAALEDIVADGADVVNNSWGEGPTAAGGEFDPLDQALINASRAGVFVSMSAGNAGPGGGTTDHPSSDYIDVAASTTTGTLASGRLSVSAPTPISDTLQNLPFGTADFGAALPPGQIVSHPFVTAESVDPANILGCDPWPAGTFTGKAAVISRGTCEFGVKVLNAEQAGAAFVVIYNSVAGGEAIQGMSPGAVGDQVTISSIFVRRSTGLGMNDWYAQHGAASTLEVNTLAFQIGNLPDRIVAFSSRGPGVGNVLKPDIAAPGVNILSQGYAEGVTGEARHLGFGQVSGTSMASPHVAGSAALLRQVHPDWSNAYIKSALMSTSKYLEIYNFDETPAQPLDMGAGRLDLTHAADPGVILDPPSLSFGVVPTGTVKSIPVTLISVADEEETYTISTLYTGAGFDHTTALPGYSVDPPSVTLPPGGRATVTVSFDPAAGQGFGDNQGFIVLDGAAYDAHMPAWARVTHATALADVLIIDNDASSSLGAPDYLAYYTSALTSLGYTYEVLDTDAAAGAVETFLPDMATLLGYRAIIYYTGDNFLSNGAIPGVPTPLTQPDMDHLTEYLNNGGTVIAMGQDMAAVLGADQHITAANAGSSVFFYNVTLGANWLQDSITGFGQPTLPIVRASTAPPAFQGINLDLGARQTTIELTGAEENPPVATGTVGEATLSYDAVNRLLNYSVSISVTTPIDLTASHIHSGTLGVNGPILYNLYTGPTQHISDTFTFSGQVQLSEADADRMLNGGLYINAHTTQHPSGEIRGQIALNGTGDGAGNQIFIDEIHPKPPQTDVGDPNMPEDLEKYVGLLEYPGPNNIEDGTVGVSHRDQPSLERPGVAYYGRSIYTSFGLEGVNNALGATSREQLLQKFLNWAWDAPTATISNTTPINASQIRTFEAELSSEIADASGVSYRWDFGDGSPYAGPYVTTQASHSYAACGTYTVRVEATDSYGNRTIGSLRVNVQGDCTTKVYLPLVHGQ